MIIGRRLTARRAGCGVRGAACGVRVAPILLFLVATLAIAWQVAAEGTPASRRKLDASTPFGELRDLDGVSARAAVVRMATRVALMTAIAPADCARGRDADHEWAEDRVAANIINNNGNGDGLVNLIRCFGGDDNTGSYVTPACQ